MSVVTLWPDASISSLDVQNNSDFQDDPTWQPTTGAPAGVYPRVLCTGDMGLTAPNTPTNDTFSLYMVGTFGPGFVVNANPDAGGWALQIDDDMLIHAAVWSTGFDPNTVVADDPIPDDSPTIIGLAFDRGIGHFNFSVNGDLVPAHLFVGGGPTASGLSDTTCNPLYTVSSYDVWIGRSNAGTGVSSVGLDGGSAFNQLIMWDRYHTAPQRAQVVTYLTEKWGL
jgi:hypothetical protein